jgi:hypothetical protein
LNLLLQRPAVFTAFFYLLFFLYVLFGIQPQLIYYYPETYLYSSPKAIAGLLDIYQGWSDALWRFYPGSICDFSGAMLSHYYAVPWLGALIIAAAAWLLSFLSGRLLSTAAGELLWLRFLPSIVLLVPVQRYENVLGDVLSLSVALAGTAVYLTIAPSRKAARIALFLVLGAAIILLSKALLVFAALCVIHELFRRRSYTVAAVLAVAGVLLSLLWFPCSFEPFTGKDNGNAGILVLFCSVPATVLTLVAFQRGRSFLPSAMNTAVNRVTGRIGFWCSMLIVLAVAGIVVKSTDKPLVRNQVRLNYYLFTAQWKKLLGEADRRPTEHFSAVYSHIVNRALFHEGRLLDDMFRYPQNAYSLLLHDADARDNKALFWRWVWSGGTLFELGLINNAENVAYEAVTRVSHYPEGLRLLALTHLVKQMPAAAKVFLCALRKDNIFRPVADGYLKRLETDSTLAFDREINDLRDRMPVKDAITGITLPELLERNPRNRMAFEYMIAQYLLARNLDSLSACTRYFKMLDYPEIPQLYEEALTLMSMVFGKETVLSSLSVRPEAMERFRRFSEVLAKYKGSTLDAQDELAGSYGSSYFFYYLYGYTGCMRQ